MRTRYFTENGAKRAADKLNRDKNKYSSDKRSSGWARFDWVVARLHGTIFGWEVRPREVRK